MGAPLGQNPQPNTNKTGTLKKCPITQNQMDCEDVITDGRYSKYQTEIKHFSVDYNNNLK